MKHYVAKRANVFGGRYYEHGEDLIVDDKAKVTEHFDFVKNLSPEDVPEEPVPTLSPEPIETPPESRPAVKATKVKEPAS